MEGPIWSPFNEAHFNEWDMQMSFKYDKGSNYGLDVDFANQLV